MLRLDELERAGKWLTTLDGRVFVYARGPEQPDETRSPVLVLHGFPTSCHDFDEAIDVLARRRRVIAFDFLGFGLSDKPERFSYSLHEQTDVALAVLRDAGVTRAHVWAHDLGTSVATELCARRERGLLPGFDMRSLTLMNGSVHVELTQLTVSQKILLSSAAPLFARLSSERVFIAQLERILGKSVPRERLRAMWTLLARADGRARMPALIGYIHERRRFWDRWIGALTRLDLPTHVAWGERDPVAVMAIAETLVGEIPGAKLSTWPDLGHYPQVEDPERVAATVERFFDAVDGVTAAT
ncbi:MAG: alpha/beta hydrolase [Polyangiaceae bacterium]